MTRRTSRLVTAAVAAAALAAAPVLTATSATAQETRTTFVVVLDPQHNAASVGAELARQHGGRLGFVYEHALNGFSLEVPARAAGALSRDRRVRSIEQDQLFTTTSTTNEIPTGVARTFAPGNENLSINHIDDQRVDVDIAIIDSGIAAHADLNIVASTNCAGGSPMKGSCTDGAPQDGNGHGTHVAGTAAALDNGVGVVGTAPGARLHGVKVLSDSGSGYTSWIIAGIEWVTKHHETIEVANMSLGCECSSSAQDIAIANSVAKGVTYAVAAGNSNKDAATFSPANHSDVITVSALADFDGQPGGIGQPGCRADEDDTAANFTNFGPSIEIAAPGVCIASTWPGGGYSTISGTSMASPHVAGAAALLASTRSTADGADTVAIKDALVGAGNEGWTDEKDSVRERLLDLSSTTVFQPRLAPVSTTPPPATSPPPGAEPAPAITLTVTGTKTKNSKTAHLKWSGTTAASVDVHRSWGPTVSPVANVGSYDDTITTKGGGTFTYKVCETSTSTPVCSNEASVTF